MDDLFNEDEFEDINDLIYEHGEGVYCLFWDSGGPGAGAGAETIFKYRCSYWYMDGHLGTTEQSENLEKLLENPVLTTLTEATESVDCSELTTKQLIDLLTVETDYITKNTEILINDEKWEMTTSGELIKLK